MEEENKVATKKLKADIVAVKKELELSQNEKNVLEEKVNFENLSVTSRLKPVKSRLRTVSKAVVCV